MCFEIRDVFRGETEGFFGDLIKLVKREIFMAGFFVFEGFFEKGGDKRLAETFELGGDGICYLVGIRGVFSGFFLELFRDEGVG